VYNPVLNVHTVAHHIILKYHLVETVAPNCNVIQLASSTQYKEFHNPLTQHTTDTGNNLKRAEKLDFYHYIIF
jgi:hypothetical protein